jgi:hypothetical protein
LYVTPGFAGGTKTWLGAVDGGYQNLYTDKCCSICTHGSHLGTAYALTSDSAGNNAAACTSWTARFIDDSSFGWRALDPNLGPPPTR